MTDELPLEGEGPGPPPIRVLVELVGDPARIDELLPRLKAAMDPGYMVELGRRPA